MKGHELDRKYTNWRNCDLCGSDRSRLLFPAENDNNPEFGVVKCLECGLVYRNYHLDEKGLRERYEVLNYEDPTPEWISGRIASFEEYIESLDQYRKNNRILDVGTGHAFFLSSCKERSWDCYGVEVAKGAVEYAEKHFGLTIFHGILEEAAFDDDYFDVVVFWNVLDEVPSPVGSLSEAFRVLRPGGAVLVRVRNAFFHLAAHRLIESLSKFKPGIKDKNPAVVHLYSFYRKTITKLFHKCGFQNIKAENAVLTWTKMSDKSESGFLGKKLIIKISEIVSQAVFILTLGRILTGPSIIVRAEKKQ